MFDKDHDVDELHDNNHSNHNNKQRIREHENTEITAHR